MELKIVLDFDGVLFNSAFEAYSVSNRCTKGDPRYRQEIPFEEFLEFRAVVTDAWQYNRLYQIDRLCAEFETLPAIQPDDIDWAFATRFFEARAEMIKDPEWAKVMAPYDFFFLLRPLLLAYPDRFAILSTRNVESIRRTMDFFDADVLPIFGQEDIRRLGSKADVAQDQGWFDEGRFLVVYVDDMNAHLEPFDGKVHLPLHANWGYDKVGTGSLSPHQVLAIVSSMLKLVKDA
jgi:hypothetical protein